MKNLVSVYKMIKMSTTGFFILLWVIVRSLDNQMASLETLFVRDFAISRTSHESVSGPLIVRNFIQFNYLANALKPNGALNRPYRT